MLEPEALCATVKRDYEQRARTGAVGLKVNLYTAVDVAALGASVAATPLRSVRLECLMVGDSIFATHHGRDSTRLRNEQDQRWGYDVIRTSVEEVSSAMNGSPALAGTYLMADLPDGCLRSTERLIRASEGLLEAGADVVKLEVDGRNGLAGLEALAAVGIPAFGHLGFTPQTGRLRRHGTTSAERRELYRYARSVRDSGACGLILEMIDPIANAALSRPSPHGLPCFSIFSGSTVPGGGLSVNAWDAVFRHPTGASGFPPTAFLEADDFPDRYVQVTVERCLTRLLALIEDGRFPVPTRSEDLEPMTLEDPW